jgi:hypothetical protein
VSHDVIHRTIEQQAAMHGDRLAIVDAVGDITYKVMNGRANSVARALMCAGLRRGGHAIVTGEAAAGLAVTLLAVLKTGAAYTWLPPVRGDRRGLEVSICPQMDSSPEEYLVVTLDRDQAENCSGPNLPVMTRGSDAACILRPFDASRTLVSHALVAGLRGADVCAPRLWRPDDAVWLLTALMDGRTLTASAPSMAAA